MQHRLWWLFTAIVVARFADVRHRAPMPRLELFPFRYRDRVTGRWVKARYVAERHVIAARHDEWEIAGPPEGRDVHPDARYFTPWKVVSHAELMRIEEPEPELQPHLAKPPAIDPIEAFLAGLFLRRHVTYCARRGQHAQMNGAARLPNAVRPSQQRTRQRGYRIIEAS